MTMANLKEDAAKVLDLAREIAVEKFGPDAVKGSPQLVTDVALLLAQLHDTRIAGSIAAKKKN